MLIETGFQTQLVVQGSLLIFPTPDDRTAEKLTESRHGFLVPEGLRRLPCWTGLSENGSLGWNMTSRDSCDTYPVLFL